jgi:acetyltransferase (GNAT) family protein
VEIMVRKHDEVSGELAAQIMTLVRCQWPQSFPKGVRTMGWAEAAPYPVDHIFATEDGVVASYMTVSRQQIKVADRSYPVLGLGTMVTSPPFRMEGYGTKVTAEATRYIREQNGIAGMLFCSPKLESFCARHGWHILDATVVYGDPNDPDTLDGEITMILPLVAGADKLLSGGGPIYIGAMKWL